MGPVIPRAPCGITTATGPVWQLEFSQPTAASPLAPAGVHPEHSLVNILLSALPSASWRLKLWYIYYFLKQGQNKTGFTQCQMNYAWHPQNSRDINCYKFVQTPGESTTYVGKNVESAGRTFLMWNLNSTRESKCAARSLAAQLLSLKVWTAFEPQLDCLEICNGWKFL